MGDFWVNSGRRELMAPMGTYTTVFHTTYLSFVTMANIEKSEGTVWAWSNPMAPFSSDLWGAICASLVRACVCQRSDRIPTNTHSSYDRQIDYLCYYRVEYSCKLKGTSATHVVCATTTNK